MRILQEDTRETKNAHIIQYMKEQGIKVIRTKAYVGDYLDMENPMVAIDKKYGLAEVYSNLVQDHERIKAEFVRAKEAGIRMIILIEEPSVGSLEDVPRWKNPRVERYYKILAAQKKGKMLSVKIAGRPPVSSAQLAKMMQTMKNRYGVEWEFCDKKDTGRRIVELLTAK